MSFYKDNMNKLLDCMGTGDYEAAAAVVNDMKHKAIAEDYNLNQLQPEWGIVCASLAMDKGDFTQAREAIESGLEADINNYELYYMLGLCYEQTGDVEDAYYAYRMAAFLGRGSQDEQIILQQFENLCSYANANAYELGKACERLVVSRLKQAEYEKTHAFLAEQLYDTNKVAANIVLAEPNMLLYMMLEIVLCEKNRLSESQFATDNTIVRYDCCIDTFNEVYKKVKLAVRRVWFGAGYEEQKWLNDLLSKHRISGDMLAVIAKYSITEACWEDAFARINAIVQYKHPQVGLIIMQYKNWLATRKIENKQKCFEPLDYDNKVPVYRLDCKLDKESDVNIVESDIAIVFCTNDELYESEVIAYLKRLLIPDGKRASIVSVWNAKGMAAAYNTVIDRVKSKYKIYIHHDTFIVKRDMLTDVISEFQKNEQIGIIGIAGTKKLNAQAKWWQSQAEDLRMCLYQDAVLNILRSMSVNRMGKLEDAEALDGIFMATSKDVIWREDIFDGWHFYDISQCFEYKRHGYRICVMNYDDTVIMHETTMKKDSANLYDKYREMFIKEYL